MNLKARTGLAALFVLPLFVLTERIEAFIQFEDTHIIRAEIRAIQQPQKSRSSQLVQSLERITCLPLEVRDQYLRLKGLQLPLLYASLTGEYQVDRAVRADRRCSSTAKALLLSAIRSANVYKVRENRQASLGRVASNDYIELDFNDFGEIVYRDIPREVFDIGMVFLHELAHRHLRLTDPGKGEIEIDSFVKGETVSFVNRIERELGLPERRHYSPVKLRYVRNKMRWGIYYGKGTDRVELDLHFGLR